MVIHGVKVSADPALDREEIASVVQEEIRLWQQGSKQLGAVDLTLEGDSIVVRASERSPIRRVRRITGYLSTVDQFNDAKKAECAARKVHM